jgi:hypothetical protein
MLTGISGRTQRLVNDNWQEKAECLKKKTVPCLLCSTNATRISDGSNPCLYHQNAAYNHLSLQGLLMTYAKLIWGIH